MEDLSRNMAEKITRPPHPKARKRPRQWTLMMVSDDGEVRTARPKKGLRNLLLVLLAVSLAAAAAFFFLWDRSRAENEQLRKTVAAYQGRLASMGVDKEEMSALLAVYRPSTEPPAGTPEEIPPEPETAPPDRSSPAPAPEPEAGEETGPAPPVGAPMASYDDAAPLVSPVGIEDFETTLGELSGALTVAFKVTNIDPDVEKAEGHVILVLRPEADGAIGGGLALPPVTLIGGRPAGNEKGQAFSITNFKRIRFTAGGETRPERFRTATVFVFNDEGKLLMEEDFPIRIDTNP